MGMTAEIPASLAVATISSLLLLRVLVGFQPHSGQNNHHGSKVAYGGDYEAQRHWMELTLHLPVGDWYWYDLQYWGLDYPPLTAYVSWLCGVASSWLVSPESVALDTSRGFEDATHKSYMRATVLVLDAFVYMSIIWLSSKKKKRHDEKSLWTVILALAQPALVLMDHGHFQYNSVSLGFALWGFYYVTKEKFINCVIGSFWFCLALNFKQMTLYYAPAIFAYLLGRCFYDSSKFIARFCQLGATVIFTFAIMWWPFVYYPPSQQDATPVERFLHVLHRIFPFQRGLFEGKVSNLWCALSVKPFSIRDRLPQDIQPIAALGTTFLLMIPACAKLFQVGKSPRQHQDLEMLLWGSASTGLSFFLASFQVHEKSILMPLAPISLLLHTDYVFVNWFGVVATWTLWPLICVDRLRVAYVCTLVIHISLVWVCSEDFFPTKPGFFGRLAVLRVVVPLTVLGMIGLHVLEAIATPPPHLQDLFPVLWSIAGCGMFLLAWIGTCWHLFSQKKEHLD